MSTVGITRFFGLNLDPPDRRRALGMPDSAVDVDLSQNSLKPFREDRMVRKVLPDLNTFMIEDCCTYWSKSCELPVKVELPCRRYFFVNDAGRLFESPDTCTEAGCQVGHPCILSAPRVQLSGEHQLTEHNTIMRQYLYAVVNRYGEIEAVSAPSEPFIADWNAFVSIDNIEAPLWDLIQTCGRRIDLYTTAPDDNLATGATPVELLYFKVMELEYKPVPVGAVPVQHFPDQTEYGDAFLPEQYDPPPRNLTDVTYWGGSQLAGLSCGRLYFTMPGNFAAWPADSEMRFYSEPLAFAGGTTYGYILTCERPEVITLAGDCQGGRCHSATRLDDVLPLAGKRSVAVNGDTCIYASTKGLVMLIGNRYRIISQPHFTTDQWVQLQPHAMHGTVHDGYYFFSSPVGSWRLRLHDNPFDTTQGTELVELSVKARAWYSSEKGRLMYLSSEDNTIYEWNSGAQLRPFYWRSQPIVSGLFKPGWVYVDRECDSDVELEILEGCSDKVLHTAKVSGTSWVKLPRWLKLRNYRLAFRGTTTIFGGYLSTDRRY